MTVKLKDTKKAYPLTNMCVRVFNRMGRLLLYNEVKDIYRSSLIRDYTVRLKGGGEICIDAGVVREIVEQERKGRLEEVR